VVAEFSHIRGAPLSGIDSPSVHTAIIAGASNAIVSFVWCAATDETDEVTVKPHTLDAELVPLDQYDFSNRWRLFVLVHGDIYATTGRPLRCNVSGIGAYIKP
jgi:hypothetical protein